MEGGIFIFALHAYLLLLPTKDVTNRKNLILMICLKKIVMHQKFILKYLVLLFFG